MKPQEVYHPDTILRAEMPDGSILRAFASDPRLSEALTLTPLVRARHERPGAYFYDRGNWTWMPEEEASEVIGEELLKV